METLEDRRLLAMGDLLQTWIEPSPSPQPGSHFGGSIATDGHCTVVGQPDADVAGVVDVGRAYVFDNATGQLVATLSSPTNTANEGFGSSVAISGSRVAVVRSYTGLLPDGDSFAGGWATAVYVFDTATGTLLHTLQPATADSVVTAAISGNILVLGAGSSRYAGTNGAGVAYVYDAVTGSLIHTLQKPSPNSWDLFGSTVAVSGSTIVVGALGDDSHGNNAGSAYVYDAVSGQLSHILSQPNTFGFGTSVSISGNLAVVGAAGNATGVGAAYVFDVQTGSLTRTISAPSVTEAANFGQTVNISGNTVFVGHRYLFDVATGVRLHTLADGLPHGGIIAGGRFITSDPNINAGAGTVYVIDIDRGYSASLNALAVGFGGTGGSWVFKQSDNSWTPLQTATPLWMVSGDLNANGQSDLVVNYGPGKGIWIRSDDGQWRLVHSVDAPAAAILDLDTDGVNEVLLSVAQSGSEGLWAFDANTNAWARVHRWAAESLTVCDFDGNGQADLAVNFLETAADPTPGLWVWKNTAAWQLLHGLDASWIVAGDLNLNGKSEIVANFGPIVGIWIYRDTNRWELVHRLGSSSGAIVDADADGQNELYLGVSSAGYEGLWQYRLDTKKWKWFNPWTPESILAGDFNGTFSDMAVDFGAKGLWCFDPARHWRMVHALNPSTMAGEAVSNALASALSASVRAGLLAAVAAEFEAQTNRRDDLIEDILAD